MPRSRVRFNSKHFVHIRCRHGRKRLERVELAYPVAGAVCEGCLSDLPALALLNTAQAREIKEQLPSLELRRPFHPKAAVESGLAAVDLASELCESVARTRATSIQGRKAGVLVVCSCLQPAVCAIALASGWSGGDLCTGCGQRLPAVRWLPDDATAGLEDDAPLTAEVRRALRAAIAPAPVLRVVRDDDDR